MSHFRALRIHEQNGLYTAAVESLALDSLPPGEVLIAVEYSSLNYKDALSAAGNKGVTRQYPHTPGIDAAGVVLASEVTACPVGSRVIVTGFDLGMNTAGGFGQRIRVPAAWCVSLPEGWSTRTAMCYGTAGLTAALCVDKLLRHGATPEQGPVLVTGASGAVGLVAVSLLARLGFDVQAVSGKAAQHEILKQLGARTVYGREVVAAQSKPMLKPIWAHAVDTVGGDVLVEVIKQLRPGGAVAACGLAAGTALSTTVFPFILRGVSLLGVDSVEIPVADKARIWQRLATSWACPALESNVMEASLEGLPDLLARFLRDDSPGKVVVRIPS